MKTIAIKASLHSCGDYKGLDDLYINYPNTMQIKDIPYKLVEIDYRCFMFHHREEDLKSLFHKDSIVHYQFTNSNIIGKIDPNNICFDSFGDTIQLLFESENCIFIPYTRTIKTSLLGIDDYGFTPIGLPSKSKKLMTRRSPFQRVKIEYHSFINSHKDEELSDLFLADIMTKYEFFNATIIGKTHPNNICFPAEGGNEMQILFDSKDFVLLKA